MNSKIIRFDEVAGNDIRYRNFSGKPGRFNKEGERSFCLFLSTETANDLANRGFKIRFRPPVDEFSDPIPYLPIKINMDSSRPPQINQISTHGVTRLDVDTISNLDWAEIVSAKISINPYEWSFGGDSGVSAYLNEMLVTIEDDSFIDEYYASLENG